MKTLLITVAVSMGLFSGVANAVAPCNNGVWEIIENSHPQNYWTLNLEREEKKPEQ